MAYILGRELAVGYNGKPVAENLNFKVNRGDYLCIVGMNGAGKSTLMKTLLSLINPVGGELKIGDGLEPHEIGYLPQQSDTQRDFPATVWEVALSGTITRNRRLMYSKAQKAYVERRLKELNIYNLKNESYRSLSGGQQQRTLLARALSATSKVLLLDEPVSGLDPNAMQQLYTITDELNQKGITIIMVTHDMAAIEHATHVLHVNKNKHFFGTKDEYLKSSHYKMFCELEADDNRSGKEIA
ncbi:MAG: ABC transporter ATP-binding protein [Lachnospiraceae bacterium]|nr:ABC transporter ATP-binding protein [Lachnospiraceae bacterium]